MLKPDHLPPAWSDALLTRVPAAIRECAARSKGVAAFDADGTLWHGDIAEDFARWMIEQGRFDGRGWKEYVAVERADPAEGARHMLRFYAGIDATRIAADVARFWWEGPRRAWILETVASLHHLAIRGFQVFVVSASPAPVMRPLGELLPVRDVLALDMEIEGGCYTGRSTGIETMAEGKLRRVRGAARQPLTIAVGDSAPDLEMLRAAELAWVLGDRPTVAAEARRRGWLRS